MPSKGQVCPSAKHFNVLSAQQASCLYCDAVIKGCPERRRCHLAGQPGRGVKLCNAAPQDVVEEFKRIQSEKDDERDVKRSRTQGSIFSAAKLQAISCTSMESNKTKTGSIITAFNTANKANADNAWAECFYSSNIPFAVANSDYFRRAVDLTARLGTPYKPPERHRLSGCLLSETYQRYCLGPQTIFFENAVDLGFSFCSDGWTGLDGVPILNYCCSVNQRDLLLDIQLCEHACTKSSDFILAGLEKAAAKLTCDMVKAGFSREVARKAMVQCITDGAAACAKARRQFVSDKPWCFEAHCSLHCLSLFFNDVFSSVLKFSTTSDSLHTVVKYLKGHEKTLLAYNELRKDKEGVPALYLPSVTRMGGKYKMLQEMGRAKEVIEGVMTHPAVQAWSSTMKLVDKEKFEEIKSSVFNRVLWEDVFEIVEVLSNVYLLLKLADGSTPAMGKVYARCLEVDIALQDAVEAARGERRTWLQTVRQFFAKRWKDLHNPLHSAGYCLDPEHWGQGQHTQPKLVADFKAVLSAWLSPEDVATAMQEWLRIVKKEGIFAQESVFEMAKKLSGTDFYMAHITEIPTLAKVATRVLSQPIAVGICERVWSSYGWIQSKLRGKLLPKRGKMLVQVYMALRMRQRAESGMWEPDAFEWVEDDRLFSDWVAISEQEAAAFIEAEAEESSELVPSSTSGD